MQFECVLHGWIRPSFKFCEGNNRAWFKSPTRPPVFGHRARVRGTNSFVREWQRFAANWGATWGCLFDNGQTPCCASSRFAGTSCGHAPSTLRDCLLSNPQHQGYALELSRHLTQPSFCSVSLVCTLPYRGFISIAWHHVTMPPCMPLATTIPLRNGPFDVNNSPTKL